MKRAEFGYHASQVLFKAGDTILPYRKHQNHCNYPGMGCEDWTYFYALDGQFDSLALFKVTTWGRHVYLTRPVGAQYNDDNLSLGEARVCRSQIVVRRLSGEELEDPAWDGPFIEGWGARRDFHVQNFLIVPKTHAISRDGPYWCVERRQPVGLPLQEVLAA